MGPTGSWAAFQGAQDWDQPEPGSRQPQGTAWPSPSSLPARREHAAKPQGARAGRPRRGPGQLRTVGFLQAAGQGRGRTAPAQVSPDPGNPQQLEPGACPALATTAPAKAPSPRGKKQVFGDPQPRQHPVTSPPHIWDPRAPSCPLRGRARCLPGTSSASPLEGAGTPGCRPRKDLRCARKLADFSKKKKNRTWK